MYCKIKAKPTPNTTPPTTAPIKLSSPPITAATKPLTKSRSSEFGERYVVGVTSAPATAPAAPAKAQPIVRTRSTRTPESREISGWKLAARSARPRRVNLKSAAKRRSTTAAPTTIAAFCGEKGIVVWPIM